MASRYIPIQQFIQEAHAYRRQRRAARRRAIISTILTRLLVILAAVAIAVIGYLTFPSTARAAELPARPRWGLDVSTTSYHLRQWARDSLNQDNPGLGLEYQYSPSVGFAAGFYKNSYSRESVYATATYTPLTSTLPAGFSVAAGGLAGVISGYTNQEAPARPLMAAALLEVRNASGWGINLVAVPNAGQSAGFVGLQLVVPLA
ncbi:conserved hypothetical protein [Thiomonas sp. X19]|uniref:hypothetical protein n=1 Tax=Thiomonas sp. X19 TaxID=1050370 RepID=UPI000B73DADB|nr:hypothetical protein [Thiomonas sp. X19]SCC95241.1 conserved hypothetical protein [Thiomonas sp. X19]